MQTARDGQVRRHSLSIYATLTESEHGVALMPHDIELRCANIGCSTLSVRRWTLDVECSTLDVGCSRHGDVVELAGFAACSLFQVIQNTSATPMQMALSATLKAGKPISLPPRCFR